MKGIGENRQVKERHSSGAGESRDGRPGLSVLTSLLVSVEIKNY